MPDASPFWQNAFLVGVLVVFGWCVWNGWRLGIVRAIWSLLAMTAAGVSGILVGSVIGGGTLAIVPTLSAITALAVGGFAALLVYIAATFLGGLLFKRTAQQPTAMLRLFCGVGGAACGAFFGVCAFWGALLFVRAMGGLCEPTVDGKYGLYTLPLPESAARALVKLKNSVEAGSTGRILDAADVMPQEFYTLMDKLGRLIADPEAMRRFVNSPGMQEVLSDSSFLALVHDPEVQEIARSRNGSALAANPKLHEALKNPDLLAKLRKIDLEKALDYALNSPQPATSPSPNP